MGPGWRVERVVQPLTDDMGAGLRADTGLGQSLVAEGTGIVHTDLGHLE